MQKRHLGRPALPPSASPGPGPVPRGGFTRNHAEVVAPRCHPGSHVGCLGLSATRMPSVGLPLGTDVAWLPWKGCITVVLPKATKLRHSLFKTNLGISLRRKSKTGWLGFEGRGSGQEAGPTCPGPSVHLAQASLAAGRKLFTHV